MNFFAPVYSMANIVARFWAAFMAILMATLPLASRCLAAEIMSIEKIQELAVSRSAQLRASAALVRAEAARAAGARLFPNPSFTFQLGQADSGGVLGGTYDFTLGQTIPFPHKAQARIRVQELQAKLAGISDSEARLIVQHSATLAAIRMANLTEISKHSIERRRRLGLIQDYLRSHPQVSPSQKIEAALIDNQIRVLEKGMLELTYEKDSAAAELNFFLQLPFTPQVAYPWLDSLPLPDRGALESRMLGNNPAIRRNALEAQRADEVVNLARYEPWPDLGLSFNYRLERLAPQNLFYSGGLTITFPLWDRGQHSVPAARALADNALEISEQAKARLRKEFEQAWRRLVTSQQELKLFPLSLVRESERKFEEAEREYRKGRITTPVFLSMDSQIHETVDSIFDTQFEVIRSLSQVLLLAGEEIHP